MNYFTRKRSSFFSALLISIFAIWGMAFPFHLSLEHQNKDSDRHSQNSVGHSCCNNHVFTPDSNKCSFQKSSQNEFCHICDLATQFFTNGLFYKIIPAGIQSAENSPLLDTGLTSSSIITTRLARAPPLS